MVTRRAACRHVRLRSAGMDVAADVGQQTVALQAAWHSIFAIPPSWLHAAMHKSHGMLDGPVPFLIGTVLMPRATGAVWFGILIVIAP
jgi:hypothetical protein